MFHPLQYLEGAWERLVFTFLWTSGGTRQWNHLVLGFSRGSLLITDSLCSLATGLFRFSNSSWFSLARLYVSKNLCISSRFPNLLVYTCSQWSLMNLCLSVASVVKSPISFLICLRVLSLLFSPAIVQVYNFIFKNTRVFLCLSGFSSSSSCCLGA